MYVLHEIQYLKRCVYGSIERDRVVSFTLCPNLVIIGMNWIITSV